MSSPPVDKKDLGNDIRVGHIQPYTRPPSDAKTAIAKIRRFDIRPLIPEGPASPARRRETAVSPGLGAEELTTMVTMELELQIITQAPVGVFLKVKRILK